MRFVPLLTVAAAVLLHAAPPLFAAGPPQLVKDIVPGSGSSAPAFITPVGNTLFFHAWPGATPVAQLWKTDGTAAGTTMVKDFPGNGANSAIQDFFSAGGLLYFTAEEGGNFSELWRSDGTTAGTFRLKDITPGPDGSYPRALTLFGNTVYFGARESLALPGLWKTNGTAAGTVKVADVGAGSMIAMGGGLYFNGTGGELWKSNGTAAGTVQAAEIEPGPNGSFPGEFVLMNGTLFFGATTAAQGRELWRSDGTFAGTVIVKDINPGSAYAAITETVVAGNTLYFPANNGVNGAELWKSDGTAEGTVMVKDIRPGSASSDPMYLVMAGDTLFFQANDGTSGPELWKSDGTAAGTVRVKDINPGSQGSYCRELAVIGSTVYFSAHEPATGYELWKSNGTEAGTVLVSDLSPGSAGSDPISLKAHDNRLYFSGTTPQLGAELWSYTVETPLLRDITGAAVLAGNGGTVSLRVEGQVNPSGLATAVKIEYGTTPALGQSQDVASFTGNAFQSFSATLYPGGLARGAVYYYRVVAANSADTTVSPAKSLDRTPGAPDTSFSGDGFVVSASPTAAWAVDLAVQPDGKIVVAGYDTRGGGAFIVTRYLASGEPDTGFGTGGTVMTDFGGGADVCTSLALQSDGKILAAGYTTLPGSSGDFALVRYNPNGTLDTTFDTDGKVTTQFGPAANANEQIGDLAVLPDGRILVTGSASGNVALARYLPGGSLDTSFNGTGKKVTDFGEGRGVTVDGKGNIVVAAWMDQGFTVLRFKPNGDADPAFGTGGRVSASINGIWDEAWDVLAQPDGKIILTGHTISSGTPGIAFHRYTETGAPDTTFNVTGRRFVTTDRPFDHRAALLQPDGKIVSAGKCRGGTDNGKMSLLRLNPDGSSDTTFGGTGHVILSPGPLDDWLSRVALDAAGDIVAAGYSDVMGSPKLAVVKVLGGPNERLVNGGFESAELLGGWAPAAYGDWGLDQASIVTAENGITPWEGRRMAKFLGTTPAGGGTEIESEIVQYVDLSEFASRISLGGVTVTVREAVNRVAGTDLTPKEFGILLRARSGTLAAGSIIDSSIKRVMSDADPATWEVVTNTFTLPPGTTHLQVMAYAQETVNRAAPEFEGHYVDGVTFSLSVPAFSPAFFSDAPAPAVTPAPVLTGLTLPGMALNFAPPPGTNLVIVENTGRDFITGAFSNLTQGQAVTLSFGGITYNFTANYYGGSGNDLVLEWAGTRAMAWGRNKSGQVGDFSNIDRLTPRNVLASGVLAGKTVVAIAAGGRHSLALCSDGTLAAWGSNSDGQLGDINTEDSTVPVAVNRDGITNKTVVAISAGDSHSLALCSDGTVAAWGSNRSGQLGNNALRGSRFPVPVSTAGVLAGKKVVAVSAGGNHSLAQCADGTLVAWGSNSDGQLGNDSTADSRVPVAVHTAVFTSGPIVAISAGGKHSMALDAYNTLAAWGSNSSGQLGNGGMESSRVPVRVNMEDALHNNILSISAGGAHSLALCADGPFAWGSNSDGQLGNNSTANSSVPVAVALVDVLAGRTPVAIAAGASHSVTLCTDGTMAAWGDNSSGQLGVDDVTDYRVPVGVNVSALEPREHFARLSPGPVARHTMALVSPPPVPVITAGPATSVALTNATLNATVNAANNETTVFFEFGPDPFYGFGVQATPGTVSGGTATAVSAVISGLTPGTLYRFRARATSAAGTVYGSDATFSTMAVNAPPVAVPQTLTALAGKPLALTLTGTDAEGNALSFGIAGQPLHGTLSGTAPALTYTPAAGYTGPDRFTFTVTDGQSVSSAAAVDITVAPDTDGDGLSDTWETAAFGTLTFSASDDPDGDGQDNAFEFLSGTAPNDANDAMILEFTTPFPSQSPALRLSPVRPGLPYRLETSLDLHSWLPVRTTIFNTPGPATLTIPAGSAVRFYRVTLGNE